MRERAFSCLFTRGLRSNSSHQHSVLILWWPNICHYCRFITRSRPTTRTETFCLGSSTTNWVERVSSHLSSFAWKSIGLKKKQRLQRQREIDGRPVWLRQSRIILIDEPMDCPHFEQLDRQIDRHSTSRQSSSFSSIASHLSFSRQGYIRRERHPREWITRPRALDLVDWPSRTCLDRFKIMNLFYLVFLFFLLLSFSPS